MLVLFIAVTILSTASATNPGVKARVTQKGLNYASSVAQKVLADELKTLHIPDQSGKDGHIEYEFKNIQNRGVTPPTSKISLDPAHHGLSWSLSGLSINLHADWRVKYKKGWIKASTSGSVDVEVKAVSVSVAISLGADIKTGRPTLKTASCNANIGGVDLDFHGGTGWILNLFKHPLEKKVRDILQGQICKLVSKEIDQDGNKALAKLKVTVEIAHKFLLDYGLVAAPVVTGSYLEIEDKGEVYWAQDKKEAPFKPQPIPASSDTSRMLYLWLTEYSGDTFAYSAQSHNFLHINISQKDLPGGNSSYLNTTCKLMCIGKLISQIGEKYPNRQVRMVVGSASTPKLSITPKGIILGLVGHIDLYADAPNKTSAYLLTLNMTVGLTVSGAIEKERLVGKITDYNFKVGVVKSAIGKLNPTKLNLVLDGIMALAVIPEVNKIAAAGVDLPVTDNVKFSNTSLKLLQGSLMVATDITYAPKTKDVDWQNTKLQLERLREAQRLRDGREPTFKVVHG